MAPEAFVLTHKLYILARFFAISDLYVQGRIEYIIFFIYIERKPKYILTNKDKIY